MVLAKYGYDGQSAASIPGALPGIKMLMGCIPSILAGATALLMMFYPLSDRSLSEITGELTNRRNRK